MCPHSIFLHFMIWDHKTNTRYTGALWQNYKDSNSQWRNHIHLWLFPLSLLHSRCTVWNLGRIMYVIQSLKLRQEWVREHSEMNETYRWYLRMSSLNKSSSHRYLWKVFTECIKEEWEKNGVGENNNNCVFS